jgi:hypothetical protein
MRGGGDGGIRTLDTPLQAYNGLANRRLQPLGHVSSGGALIEAGWPDCKPREPGIRRASTISLDAYCPRPHRFRSQLGNKAATAGPVGWARMHLRFFLVATPMLICTLATGATAQEYCVTCTGPDASYRCLIGGDVPLAARASRGQFLCITEIAKAGGHASCSAARAQATPCPGETRTVMFPPAAPGATPLADTPPSAAPMAPMAPMAPTKEIAPAPMPPPEQQQAQPPVPHDPPAPGEAPTNTAGSPGDPVTNTVKKTWKCITSLFGDC